jgi:hypothetical protein
MFIHRRRTAESLQFFLGSIKSAVSAIKGVAWEPPQFNIDFELAEKKAVMEVFPNTVIKYCYFHLKQSVRRKLVALKCTEAEIVDIVLLCFLSNSHLCS